MAHRRRKSNGMKSRRARSAVRPVTYDRYIRSWRWQTSSARLAELRASGYRCRACDRGPPEVRLEVHHRTYKRLGRERVRDLTTFCSDCHGAITNELRGRRYLAVILPVPANSCGTLPRRELLISDWLDDRRG